MVSQDFVMMSEKNLWKKGGRTSIDFIYEHYENSVSKLFWNENQKYNKKKT